MLLVDLNDPKTKSVAETITSSTSRKILDYLAGVETASESEVSETLSLAISTVHYHLQKLVEAELVEVSGFTYSKKGREINRYALANKYIIITPRKVSGLKSKLRKILPIAAVPLGLGFVLKVVDLMQQTQISSASMDYAMEAEVARNTAAIEESALVEGADSLGFAEDAASDTLMQETLHEGTLSTVGFEFGLHEIAIVLSIISVLIIIGYFIYDWRKNE